MAEMDREAVIKAYEIGHDVLMSTPAPGEECCGAPRRPYRATQWVAPYDGSAFPDESEFFAVRCHDLSQSEISFVTPEKPDFSTLVISLGDARNRTFVSAEIVRCPKVRLLGGGHIEIVDDEDESDEDPMDYTYMVGCRFTGRL